jgi:hypothetical protein
MKHPNVTEKYSAGTSLAFALRETQTVANIVRTSNAHEAKRAIIEDDVLGVRRKESRITYAREILNRLHGADNDLLDFLNGSAPLARQTNLYLILLHRRLLREFTKTQVVDAIAATGNRLPEKAIVTYKRELQSHPIIGNWAQRTINRSASNVVTILVHAGILERIKGTRDYKILPQWIEPELRDALITAGHEEYLELLLDAERM